jgi:hypothetical protein
VARTAITKSGEEAALMHQGNQQHVQCCGGLAMAEADKNEQWLSREYIHIYLLEMWDTGPHQDPARKKRQKKRQQTQKRDNR